MFSFVGRDKKHGRLSWGNFFPSYTGKLDRSHENKVVKVVAKKSNFVIFQESVIEEMTIRW